MHAPSNANHHQDSPTRRCAALGWLPLFACGAVTACQGTADTAAEDPMGQRAVTAGQGMSVLEGNR